MAAPNDADEEVREGPTSVHGHWVRHFISRRGKWKHLPPSHALAESHDVSGVEGAGRVLGIRAEIPECPAITLLSYPTIETSRLKNNLENNLERVTMHRRNLYDGYSVLGYAVGVGICDWACLAEVLVLWLRRSGCGWTPHSEHSPHHVWRVVVPGGYCLYWRCT